MPVAGWACRSSVACSGTHAATTARYAHLDNDPLRRASEAIGARIAAALESKKTGDVVTMVHRTA